MGGANNKKTEGKANEKFLFAKGWRKFFLEELNIIGRRRSRLKSGKDTASGHTENGRGLGDIPYTLVGLSLSGGGIRSCLFNLGVLQEMSRLGLLKIVDILSTVSGGGYIGGCLASLLSIKKPPSPEGQLQGEDVFSFADGDEPLFETEWDRFPFRDWRPMVHGLEQARGRGHTSDPDTTQPRQWTKIFPPKWEMRHLRVHSNFLLPAGFSLFESLRSWGASTLHLMAPMMWFFCLIALVMLIYMAGLQALVNATGASITLAPYGLTVIKEFLATNLRAALQSISLSPWILAIAIALYFCMGCLLLYMPLFKKDRFEVHHFWHKGVSWPISALGWWGIPMLIILQVCLYAMFDTSHLDAEVQWNLIPFLFEPFYFSLACLVTAFLCLWVEALFTHFDRIHLRSYLYIMAGVALTMTGFTSFLGLLPVLVKAAHFLRYSLFLVVLAVGTRGLIMATHKKGQGATPGDLLVRAQGVLLNILVVIIVILFLLLMGHALDKLVWGGKWLQAGRLPWPRLYSAGAGALLLFLFLSYTDFNRVSAHYFYGDRLAEAFLQTSRARLRDDDTHVPGAEILRKTTSMTLLDLHGKVKGKPDCTAEGVASYGPYYIISATLNLTSAHDLHGLKRRTEPFWFSRLFIGSDRTGYVSTWHYADLKLVRALTISGAAISPVMGMYTNRMAAFACCLLGIRLGFWLKNPKCILEHCRSGRNPSPCTSSGTQRGRAEGPWITRLLNEFTGNANATGEYIYLSDGGHCGDNLGIVPLLKRRSKLVIASDAECDPAFSFNSLNSSLRSIYVDEGIKIDLNIPRDFVPGEAGFSARHYLVGRILYPDRPWQASWLVVLKSSLTGDELAPILNYKRKSPQFPHEATTDQFFSEEQFESYRALGRHIMGATFGDAVEVAQVRRLDLAWNNIDTMCRCLYIKAGHGREKVGGLHRWDDLFKAMWDTDQIETSPRFWPDFKEKIASYANEVREASLATKGRGVMISDYLIRQLFELDTWLKEMGVLKSLTQNQEQIPRDYRGFLLLKYKYDGWHVGV